MPISVEWKHQIIVCIVSMDGSYSIIGGSKTVTVFIVVMNNTIELDRHASINKTMTFTLFEGLIFFLVCNYTDNPNTM